MLLESVARSIEYCILVFVFSSNMELLLIGTLVGHHGSLVRSQRVIATLAELVIYLIITLACFSGLEAKLYIFWSVI